MNEKNCTETKLSSRESGDSTGASAPVSMKAIPRWAKWEIGHRIVFIIAAALIWYFRG